MKFILLVLGMLALTLIIYFFQKSESLSHKLEEKELELETARKENALLKKRANISEANRLALETLAQGCLNREKQARAETEEWKRIFEDMEVREITPQEKKEVPDEKTRTHLLDALDEPL